MLCSWIYESASALKVSIEKSSNLRLSPVIQKHLCFVANQNLRTHAFDEARVKGSQVPDSTRSTENSISWSRQL